MDKLEEAHKHGIVLGLANVAGVVQRIDIDLLLLEQPDTFNLLLIALMELQGMEGLPWEADPDHTFTPADPMSFFQLAGIHGLPGDDWAGVKSKGGGYCQHAMPTFLPWHRPYLALLEQTLFRQVSNVAKRFSESPSVSEEQKKKYIAAAKQFRLPYWDYFRPRGYAVTFPGVTNGSTTTAPYDYHMPQIFTLPEVMVKTLPDNKLTAMRNPFWRYEFSAGESEKIAWRDSTLSVDEIGNSKKFTIRYGSGSGESDPKSMNQVLNKIREDEMRASLVMMEDRQYENFKAISTSGVNVGQDWEFKGFKEVLRTSTGSLEGLHNDYHVYIGGFQGPRYDRTQNSGHMTSVPVAAFDPIFWIHHCQIDRLFAIWQAANDTKHWFNELDTNVQHLRDADLLPFRMWPSAKQNSDNYWTSDRVRDTTVFGYEYPETGGDSMGDQVRDDFARRYAWSRRQDAGVNQQFGRPPDDMQPLEVGKAQVFQYTSGMESGKLFKPVVPPPFIAQRELAAEMIDPAAKVSHEWSIDAIVERMAVNGSYTIFYIIGDARERSGQEWSSLPGFVGVSHIFTAAREACDNCRQQQDQAQLVTSTTLITSLLLDYVKNGQLGSLDPDDVEPFLVENLKWRVQPASGKPLDPRVLAKEHMLKLSISHRTVSLAGKDRSGQGVKYSYYPQIIESIIQDASLVVDSVPTSHQQDEISPACILKQLEALETFNISHATNCNGLPLRCRL